VASLLELLVGPMAAIECQRSLGRGWVLLVRALATLPPAMVLLAVLWFWWFSQQMMPDYSPGPSLAGGVAVVEAMLVTAALLVGQALLAGTLAGDKARSTLGLLLTTRVSPREIVVGRLAGRLCVVGVLLAAGLPALVWLAALYGLGLGSHLTLVALPAAVSFGGGGLALAVSAVARRARDALLMVYLFEIVLLLAPVLSGSFSAGLREWIDPLNPYHAIGPLSELDEIGPAMATIGLWLILGVAGCAWAAWRLRPAYLSDADGRRRWRLFRPARLPALRDRPMLWKELYVEQGEGFGRFVKWVGILAVVVYAGGAIVLAGLLVRDWWLQGETSRWAAAPLQEWLGVSWLMAWIFEWAVGLRAAAAITAERQRGTWDLLLTTPLEGRDMVLAKIYGSIHALRGFFAAVVIAWLAGLVCGALPPLDFAELLVQTLVIGAFMGTVGMAFSLNCKSAASAMTLTIVAWLGAGCAFAALAGILMLMVMLAWFVASFLMGNLMPGPGTGLGPWSGVLYYVLRMSLYSLATLLIGAYILRRVDTLIGRSPVAVAPSVRRKEYLHAERAPVHETVP